MYETFLYIVAALLKTGGHDTLRSIFTAHYLRPETENYGNGKDFHTFTNFFSGSPGIHDALGGLQPGYHYLSTAAELIKRQASRSDLPFTDIMQAELLIQLMTFVTLDDWFPHTLFYATYSQPFPFFVRAARKRDFEKLAKITGIAEPELLRVAATKGKDQYDKNRYGGPIFWHLLNIDKLGSVS